MFRRLPDAGGERVPFTIDGRPASARAGDTVAAALLANGVEVCRTTPVSGAPRAPYCMMGVCFECLVTVDGVGNRQGCLVLVEAGMRVETQKGARSVAVDAGAGASS
jgi:predicted molibdopterin-dependent oxidoreductase YjgC